MTCLTLSLIPYSGSNKLALPNLSRLKKPFWSPRIEHIGLSPTSVEILPPFGMSDYNTITISLKQRTQDLPSRRTVLKRDTRPSRKMELGRYLSEIDWSLFEDLDTFDEKCELLSDIISTRVNFIMPERKVKFHTNDASWVTKDFKLLIMLRERAF